MRIFGFTLIALSALFLSLEISQAASDAPTSAPEGLMDAFARAQRASAAEDWSAMRDALRKAASFAPSHPTVLLHLARAEALTGNVEGALASLQRLAQAGGTNRDLATDKAFDSLRTRPDFKLAMQRLHDAARPIVRGEVAFELADRDLIIEGIAYHEHDDVFFIGSLDRGQILRVTRDGSTEVFVSDAAGATEARRGQVLGLRVDAARALLWAATLVVDTAAPAFQRGPGGWASLRSFALDSGKLTASYAPEDTSSPHLLNDIALAPNGDVYVTDSEGEALLRLANGANKFSRVHGDSPRFSYPNGIVVDAPRARVYVAHVEGISTFPLSEQVATSAVVLETATGATTSGIDGLYVCGNGLLAIQAVLDSQQVAQFTLNAGGDAITATKVLERKHPAHAAATTGAIAKDAFYYIAASQLDRLQPDGTVSPAKNAESRSSVVRLPLEDACAD